jgi:orotate phosphoribosyltransferase
MSSALMDLFEETGAYLRGHFRLTSGLHSGEYLQCAKVLAYPAYAERLGSELARHLREIESGKVDAILAPALGGIIIGHEVARSFGVPFLFAERDNVTGQMALRRGFEVQPGQAVIVVEDVVTTGGSSREVVDLALAAGATVAAAGSIIDRSNGRADIGVPRVALERLDVSSYEPNRCPYCAQGMPIVKPGSRKT